MKKILLIEDDIALRENISEILVLTNYHVITAANGKIGIELAIKELPDIIICDIMMPELDGYGVLKTLSTHQKTSHIPFVFLSAKTTYQNVRMGMDLGADDYITKPFTEEELISAIESRLAKAAILQDQKRNIKTTEILIEDTLKTLHDLKIFFEKNGTYFTYKKGEFVYREGDNSNLIYLITKGIVKCYNFDEQGKELITSLHIKNDLFGYTSFSENKPYRESATAVKDIELKAISKSDLKVILDENHNITLELIELLTDNISGIKDQLLQMAYSSVTKKTAITLLKFAEKMNKKPEEPIQISRSDLASVAGIATETLIRSMSNLKKQGIITIEGRNIKILDVQALKDSF